ncbi:MAG: hypothetical protein M1837_006471 [Sclerophora amabilis]|nr:MAG: hypothetical protein M1837_006471 [Sclerophora amabilis]
MLSSVFMTALSGLALVNAQSTTTPVTGKLGDALVVNNNPIGVTYTATLPGTSVKGSISGTSGSNGTGVNWKVDFSNFPTEGGPFLYHIHDQPVPEDGNCTQTLAHLDPTERGEVPVCDPSQPQTCQTGDLGGKHGSITEDPFSDSYLDIYSATVSGIGAFFGNRSVVVHYANKTRISCANFVLSGSGSSNSTNGTTPNRTSPTTPITPAEPSFTAGASATIASLSMVMAAFAAAAFL